MKSCTVASHEALKADPVAWAALPNKWDWHFGADRSQLRHCSHCHSTPAFSVEDPRALAVLALFALISLCLLARGGRLHLPQIFARGAVFALALGFLLAHGCSVRSQP